MHPQTRFIDSLEARKLLNRDVSVTVFSQLAGPNNVDTRRREQAIVVSLDTNGNQSSDAGDKKAVSSKSGIATFKDVPDGTYRVFVEPMAYPFIYLESIFPRLTVNDEPRSYEVVLIRDNPPINTLKGSVFFDRDQSGTYSDRLASDDTGVRGVRVYLDANQDGKRNAGEINTMTDAQGGFVLQGMKFTQKHSLIRVTLPNGYVMTGHATSVGLDGTTRFNIGVFRQFATATLNVQLQGSYSNVGVRAYLDLNRDAKWTRGEPRQYTDGSGRASFNVLPGKYRMRIGVPAGLAASQRYIEVKVGDRQSRTRSFGLSGAHSSHVAFFYDADRDSARDAGEPLLSHYNTSLLMWTSNVYTAIGDKSGISATGAIRFDKLPGVVQMFYDQYLPGQSTPNHPGVTLPLDVDADHPLVIAISYVPDSWFDTYPELAPFAR